MREMPIIPEMPIMPIILGIPEMPVIPEMPEMPIMLVTNFAKGASRTGKNFGKVCAVKSDISEDSEGNGEVRKRVERDFGEKRL